VSLTPFFIIGNPRSGTSLFRLMLNSHPKITVPPECGFIVWLYENFATSKLEDKKVINCLVDEIIQSRKFETWGLDRDLILEYLSGKNIKSYSEFCTSIFLIYALKNKKTPIIIGDKNNYYVKHINTINKIFESPKFIFIVRDVRDVSCSYLELKMRNLSNIYAPIVPNSLKLIASEWVENNLLILDESKKNPKNTFIIKYEDLIVNPTNTLQLVCDFLNIDFDERMLSYYLFNDEPSDFLSWKEKTLMSPISDNHNKYHTILSSNEIEAIELIAKKIMSELGYK
jgi:Sulfotransferase family